MFTISNMENRCVEKETSTAPQQGTDQNITSVRDRVVSCLMFKGIFYQNQRCIILFNIVTTLFAFFQLFYDIEGNCYKKLPKNTFVNICILILKMKPHKSCVEEFYYFRLNGFTCWECRPLITKKIKNMLQEFQTWTSDSHCSKHLPVSLHWLS